MGNTTGSTSASAGSKGTSGKGGMSGISVGVLGNLRLPGKTRKKPKYRTAEDLCKQILFEYPFLKSVFSGGNVTAGCGGLGSVVVADHYASIDDAIVWVSDGFERLTMYSREDVLGTNCRFLQGPDTSPEAISSISKAIKAGESIQLEVLNYRKDGTAFWNNLRLLPVHGPGKISGTVYNVVAFQEDVGTLADISSKGNIYDWRARDVDVWLRRHKYGHYAKLFLAQNVTGEFLAQLTKKQMRELVSATNKDAFMASIISADADALYSLVRSQKKTSRPKLVISPSTSSSMLSSGEGSEDAEQEKSETEMDKRTKEDWQHFPRDDSHSSEDSSDGSKPAKVQKDWKLELASNPLFQAKSEDSLSSPRATNGAVAIKYAFEDREAVVLLVPKWVTFEEFKQRIAYECGAPGWDFDMTWRVRFNEPAKETGQLERSPSSSTAQRISSGENLSSRASPRAAAPTNEKKIVMVATEGEWKKLLDQAKGTVLMYCSKPVVLSKAKEETEGHPGIP